MATVDKPLFSVVQNSTVRHSPSFCGESKALENVIRAVLASEASAGSERQFSTVSHDAARAATVGLGKSMFQVSKLQKALG